MATVIDPGKPEQVDGFYVYAHRRADDGRVFYIGKGSGRRAWVTRRRNPFWTNTAYKHGLAVEILASGLSCDEALSMEIAKIAEIGIDRLCNLTVGGEGASGYVMSEENRRLLSLRLTGREVSIETREKISSANSGRKRSAEAVMRHAESIRGRKLSPEHIEKIRAGNVGKVFSAESREKISKAMAARVITEEARKNMSLSHIGKKRSAESIAKQSKTMKSKSDEEVMRMKSSQTKAIECSNGMVFLSLSAASKWLLDEMGLKNCKGAVSACARGIRGSAYGFSWKYLEAN